MVKEVHNVEDIVNLWQEAFGDSTEDIMFFINNISHGKCIGIYEGATLVSMLYLVDCHLKSESSGYIYAACTLKSARGQGYMSRLLAHCRSLCTDSLCLIPANESLVRYYNKNGFNKVINVGDIFFDESEEICSYLFEGCELDNPIGLLFTSDN